MLMMVDAGVWLLLLPYAAAAAAAAGNVVLPRPHSLLVRSWCWTWETPPASGSPTSGGRQKIVLGFGEGGLEVANGEPEAGL